MPLDTHLHPDMLYVYDVDDLEIVTAMLSILYDATVAGQPAWPMYTFYDRLYQPYGLTLAAN